MTRDEAAAILRCNGQAPHAELVRQYFRIEVLKAHPDTGVPRYPHSVETLKKARDVLLAAVDSTRPTECATCRGTGWISTGFKQERCPRGC